MEIKIENLDFSNLDKKISHLTKEQIVSVMEKYYGDEKVANIIEEYQLNISVSQLFSLFPPVKTDEVCIHCGSTIVQPWASKTWSSMVNEYRKYCINCGHEISSYCYCHSCKEIERQKRLEEKERIAKAVEKKQSTITKFYDEENWDFIHESELTLEDRLYLAAILRSSLSENTMYVETLKGKRNLLAPTAKFEIELIKTLTGRDILVPHVLSDLDAFDIEYKDEKGEKFTITYGIYNVRYRINIIPYDFDYNEMIKRLMYPDFSGEANFIEFCYDMWKKIALHECLEYLLYQMNAVGYSFNPGDKTIRVFEYLLENFSVAQIYGIIYRSVATSTKRYQAGEISFIHAQNAVISSCESHGQRAIAQDWKLSNYSRIRDLPETYISGVFFTSIMQIAELGFLEKPTLL